MVALAAVVAAEAWAAVGVAGEAWVEGFGNLGGCGCGSGLGGGCEGSGPIGGGGGRFR